MSNGLPPPERSLLSLVRMGGAEEVRLLTMDSREELCDGFMAGALLVSTVREDMDAVRRGAVLPRLMSVVEMADMEVVREDEEVVVSEEEDEVAEDELVEIDEDEVAEGARNEVNDTVETKPGPLAVFTVPVAPPLEPEDWLLTFGHNSLTPDPLRKAEMMSPPGSCKVAQACLTSEESACNALAQASEHGLPLVKSEVLQPEIDCV
ncbi:MAG: hypothetical protein M1822_001993 [Bathelium mastoideum]|nr:MAG: hypothetical protein M1822_001993 [Bathelium mastoideum]